jgi:LysM repeat protein
MSYVKPHLSPELRAQITPQNKRDKKLAAAGVFLLLGSAYLAYNFLTAPEDNSSAINDKLETIGAQTPAVSFGGADKQVLGVSTTDDETEEDASPAPTPAVTPAPTATPSDDQFTSYTVKSGDTLFNISQSYNVKWDLIAQFNNLSEPYLLHGGQVLKIPQATTSSIPNKIYTIAKGDTLASIAKKYNITVDDIIAVNPNLQKSDLISIGQVIKLP